MKMWAWVFGLGGAFTVLAGYMAARARAQALGVVVPAGLTLTSADIDFINKIYQQKLAEGGVSADCPFATCPDGGINGYLVLYKSYLDSPSAFAQAAGVAAPSAGMTFEQFARLYG